MLSSCLVAYILYEQGKRYDLDTGQRGFRGINGVQGVYYVLVLETHVSGY